MLKVNRELCLGCGLCAKNCPRQAISLISGTASIDQTRCNQCRRCLEVCPQGAIIEVSPIAAPELRTVVTGLQEKAAEVIARIERLKINEDNTIRNEE